MSPEQFEIFLEDNRKSTAEAIEKTVNGKIRNLQELFVTHIAKVEAHMTKVEPYIDGAESATKVGKFVGKSLMATGAFVLTVGGAILFLIGRFK